MDLNLLVALLPVDGVEHPYLVKADDVPEVPAHYQIDVCDGGKRDVQQVIGELGRYHPSLLVSFGQFPDSIVQLRKFWLETQQLRVLIPHLLRRRYHLGCHDLGEDRFEVAKMEV